MNRRLTLLQINDTHGYLEPHPEHFWEGDEAVYREAGGYARIATIFEKARAENPGGVIALDNGDTFHGTYPAVTSRGEAFIAPLNALALDAMTAHWDFAYGPAQLRSLVEKLSYPLLALNCYDKETGQLAFPPSLLVERAGVRVGIIGIAATIVDKTMPEHFSTGLRFTLGRDELPEQIQTLRDAGAETIVVLSHLGFPQDIKLASEVGGIDVLVSGHTHNRLYEPVQVGCTWIIQSGCHGSFVGRLDLEIGEKGNVESAVHQLISVDTGVPAQAHMQELVEEAVAPYREVMNTQVGETRTALSRDEMLGTTMDQLLLAAVSEAANVPIAFSNGWRYGAPIPPGPVTLEHLWNIVPPNPPVSLVEMTGSELWAMMEENLERTFACEPYEQMGGYVKRCRGITVYVKIENPTGLRIQRFFIRDKLLDLQAEYTVAFITNQGVPAKYGQNRRNLPIHVIDALQSYFEKHSPVTIEATRNVVMV